MVTVAIVISLQAVGNILVLALLVTPAACARLLTDGSSSSLRPTAWIPSRRAAHRPAAPAAVASISA